MPFFIGGLSSLALSRRVRSSLLLGNGPGILCHPLLTMTCNVFDCELQALDAILEVSKTSVAILAQQSANTVVARLFTGAAVVVVIHDQSAPHGWRLSAQGASPSRPSKQLLIGVWKQAILLPSPPLGAIHWGQGILQGLQVNAKAMLLIVNRTVPNARSIHSDTSVEDAGLTSINIAITEGPKRAIPSARLEVMWLAQFETLYGLGPVTTLKTARLFRGAFTLPLEGLHLLAFDELSIMAHAKASRLFVAVAFIE